MRASTGTRHGIGSCRTLPQPDGATTKSKSTLRYDRGQALAWETLRKPQKKNHRAKPQRHRGTQRRTKTKSTAKEGILWSRRKTFAIKMQKARQPWLAGFVSQVQRILG